MSSARLVFATGLCALLSGCAPEGSYRLGLELGDLVFDYYSPTMGVHPDVSILEEPSNLFAAGLSEDDKWQLESEKSRSGYTVACFYAWASMLAYQPSGEHQYYTAAALHDMFLREEAEPEDL